VAYSRLGADWQANGDGIRSRRAARVILLDADRRADQGPRVLLVRGHEADQPSRSWWFAVGGGMDAGETPRQAAIREACEETGILLDDADLVGPVLTRLAIFDFYAETVRQDEEFFAARVSPRAVTTAGWTDVERELLDELAWLTPAQLRAQPLEYFPENLPDAVETLHSQLCGGGWDGITWHLGDQDDDAGIRGQRAED
jgi:8-oxo-dGTP pyrophosphatase MutT (NUDIX family)